KMRQINWAYEILSNSVKRRNWEQTHSAAASQHNTQKRSQKSDVDDAVKTATGSNRRKKKKSGFRLDEWLKVLIVTIVTVLLFSRIFSNERVNQVPATATPVPIRTLDIFSTPRWQIP